MKKKHAQQTAQQGDVLLRRLVKLPDGERKVVSRSRLVVAEDDEAELIQIGERILLSLKKQATIVHPEHKPITLAPGIWEVGRVVEYDWFQQMTRQVMD